MASLVLQLVMSILLIFMLREHRRESARRDKLLAARLEKLDEILERNE